MPREKFYSVLGGAVSFLPGTLTQEPGKFRFFANHCGEYCSCLTHSWLPLSDRHTKSSSSGRSLRYAGGLPNCVCLNVPEARLFYLSFINLLDSLSRTSVASRLLRQALVSSHHRSHVLQGASPRLFQPHLPTPPYVTWWLVMRVPNTLKSPYGHWPIWNRVLPVRSHSAAV